MKIRNIYKKVNVKNYKLKFTYDKTSKGRPAWIKVSGLPAGTNFISVHLGKKGKKGQRIQFYKTYLPEGLFLPIDYTKEEMMKFYDQWSNQYDKSVEGNGWNIEAAKFLLKRVKRYIKKGEMLDLGAGTGSISEIFVKNRFYPATLVDYSGGMLKRAKKRKSLKGCNFIRQDIRKLELNKKFNFILSFFSFGSSSYFSQEEMNKILDIASIHLKKGGIIAVLGHTGDLLSKRFRVLEKGIYTLSKKDKFYTDYFIGQKKN